MHKFGHLASNFVKRKLLENSRFPNVEILNLFGSFLNYSPSFWLVLACFGWFQVLVSTQLLINLTLILLMAYELLLMIDFNKVNKR